MSSAPTKVNGDGLIRMAWQNPHGAAYRSARTAELHSPLVFEVEPFRGSGTEKNGIVPGELRHGTRQFLEPDVVGVAPVVEIHIRTEYQFQFASLRRRLRR